MPIKSLRRYERKKMVSMIHVGWQDASGNDKAVKTRSSDISEAGLRFELPEAVPDRSFVSLRSQTLGLNTRASVRSCVRQGNNYSIGVEFVGGFRWRAPNEEVRKALEEQQLLAV